MKTPDAAIDLIKRFEGLSLEAYKDPVGIWTIGYGTTSEALPGLTVRPGMKITEAQAEDYLRRTVDRFAADILPAFKREPTPNQFGAMVSLAYNIGPGAFRKSTALKRFNAGDLEGAAEAMRWWNKAGGKVLRGLVRRREAEVELFLDGAPDEQESRIPPDDLRENPATSKSILSGIAGALAAVSAAIPEARELAGYATEVFGIDPDVALRAVVLGALAFMAWDRWQKWRAGVR